MTKPAERPATVATAANAPWRVRHWLPRGAGVPFALVALAVGFNLWVLRDERLLVSYPNDSATHLQMVQWATTMLSHGMLPFTHWYANLSLGSPYFVQYQSASAVLIGLLGLGVGAPTAFAWTLYLLLALWPLCVYWTARLLGWGRWEAGIAAVIAPVLFSVTGRGFEDQAYTWIGSGLWSQLWAMWTLPLAIGFGWRYVARRQYLFGAVAFTALTIAFHFVLSYLLIAVLVLMVFLKPRDVVGRLRRGAVMGIASLVASAWVWLPWLASREWSAPQQFQVNTHINDSWGPGRIFDWLVSGQIFDWGFGAGRFPIVTILVAVGVVACVVKCVKDERARLLLVMLAVSLVLFSGRGGPNGASEGSNDLPHNGFMNFVLNLVPFGKDLLFQRYVGGVQLAGLLLAGVGVVWVAELTWRWLRASEVARVRVVLRKPWVPVAAGVLAIGALVAALAPGWSEAISYNNDNNYWITQNQPAADASQGAEVTSLLDLAADQGGGRVYAGEPSNWGYGFTVGSVQVYIYMMKFPAIDAVGFTFRGFGLMTNPEAYFDEYNPGDYRTFGVRYLLLPVKKAPMVPATLDTTAGQYALWTVDGVHGVFQVVDTIWPAIYVTRGCNGPADDPCENTLGPQSRGFLDGTKPLQGLYRPIAYDGRAPATPTLTSGVPRGPAGTVVSSTDDLFDGRASATVVAKRSSVVLLSAAYDPGWTVTVDGTPQPTEMVSPALVGVKVGPGRHVVSFVYRGYGSYPLLFVLALLALLCAGLGPLAWRRRLEAPVMRVVRSRWPRLARRR